MRPLHLAAAPRGNRSLRSEALARDHKTQRWQKHDSNPGLTGFPACGRCHNSLHSASRRWSRLIHTDHRVPFPGFPLTVQHAECENTLYRVKSPGDRTGGVAATAWVREQAGPGWPCAHALFTGRRQTLWPDRGTSFPGPHLPPPSSCVRACTAQTLRALVPGETRSPAMDRRVDLQNHSVGASGHSLTHFLSQSIMLPGLERQREVRHSPGRLGKWEWTVAPRERD